MFRIADFVSAPRRRYYVGATYLVWCHGDTLGGSVAWGQISDTDAAELEQLWEYDRALRGPLCVVTDVTALTNIDAMTFERLLRYVQQRLPDYEAHVHRHALIRPRGFSGALVAGFNTLLSPRYEWQVFDERAAAFAWLGRSDEMAATIGELVATIIGRSRIVGAVAALLAQDPRIDVEEAAKQLARSSRTLQRELQEDGTSFRDQIALARLTRARVLLETTDQKLDAIALAVGLATSSQLVRLFNQQLGESPGAYRERTRGATR